MFFCIYLTTNSDCCHLQHKLIGFYNWDNCLLWGANWAFNPLNAEFNPICRLLALFGAHHILHVSRIRVKYSSLRFVFKSLSNSNLSPILHNQITALLIESMLVNLLSLVSSLPEVQALGKHRLSPLICVVFRAYVTAWDTWQLNKQRQGQSHMTYLDRTRTHLWAEIRI